MTNGKSVETSIPSRTLLIAALPVRIDDCQTSKRVMCSWRVGCMRREGEVGRKMLLDRPHRTSMARRCGRNPTVVTLHLARVAVTNIRHARQETQDI